MSEVSGALNSPSREQQLLELKGKLKEYDYVRFTLTDIVGIPRTRLVPARNAYDVLESGIYYYTGVNALGANSELVFTKEVNDYHCGNVLMIADLDTFHDIPWVGRNKYKYAEVFIEPGGPSDVTKIFRPACCRFVAREQFRKLEKLGYKMLSSIEWEYFLFHRETEKPVYDKWLRFFSPALLTEHQDWFTDLDKHMYKAGVNLEVLENEYAFGQFELSAVPEYGIKGIDNNVLLKMGMREIALQKGWQANFMAKVSGDQLGSGAHFNFSIWDKKTGANAFYDVTGPNKLSPMAQHWIAGMLKHAPALTALCCPTTNDYQRLHRPWTPDLINWGVENRMSMLRVKNDGAKNSYMENRIPSSLANPYLVAAGVLAAGMDGVVNKLPCPEPDQETGVPTLPHTLEEALDCLVKDQVILDALGKTMVDWFLQIKKETDLKAIEGVTDVSERFKIERTRYGETC